MSSPTILLRSAGFRALLLFLAAGTFGACGAEQAEIPRGGSLDLTQGLDEAFSAITGNPDTRQRAAQWVEFFSSIDPSDASRVAELFKRSLAGQDEVSATLFASWWAQHDPRGALGGAYRWPWDGRKLGTRVVLYEWARVAPQQALEGLGGLPGLGAEEVENAGRAWVRGFVASGSAPSSEAALFIERIDDLMPRALVMETFIKALASRDGLEATREYVESLGERDSPGLAREFFRVYAGTAAASDPAEAKAFVAKHADGVYGRNLRRRLGARWALSEGEDAMEWARVLPVEDGREDVVEHTFRNFVYKNRARAIEWMREHHQDPALEGVLPMFLAVLSKQDPEQAIHWLPRVSDARKRQRTAEKVVKEWLRKDPEAAMVWVESSELPPHVKRSLSRLRAEKS